MKYMGLILYFSWQIVLLTLESQYVQHLAGNVFGFISEFVATSVCYDFLFWKFNL
jgi:hypothetical protein